MADYYLEHAFGRGGAHKYIAKIGEGAKARYFYSREELAAYYRDKKKTVSDAAKTAKKAVEDKVGITDKKKAEAAWAKVPKKVETDKDKAAFRRADRALYSVKNSGKHGCKLYEEIVAMAGNDQIASRIRKFLAR